MRPAAGAIRGRLAVGCVALFPGLSHVPI